MPDHSDYFEQLASSPLASKGVRPDLPLESSRGCWWGEKCQCVFCGDPPHGLAYRSKSARRVLAEIKRFAKDYRFCNFNCVDEALDKNHITAVFAKLGRSRSRPPIAYQVRADLTRNELRTLSAAGVKYLVAGIESLSNAMLRLMRKGTTALGNIQLLRWCEELGIRAGWNILCGFPGEPVSEYERMAEMVPLLTHLRPPFDLVHFVLKRFSPYGMDPGHFGLTNVRPWPSYAFVYPFNRRKLMGISDHFSFRYADGRQPFEYTRPLRRKVDEWANLWQTPDRSHPRLDMRPAGDDVVINDTRPCAARGTRRLRGLAAKIYRQCDSVQSLGTLVRVFHGRAHDAELKKILEELVASKLMIRDEDKYLSLAVRQKALGR